MEMKRNIPFSEGSTLTDSSRLAPEHIKYLNLKPFHSVEVT